MIRKGTPLMTSSLCKLVTTFCIDDVFICIWLHILSLKKGWYIKMMGFSDKNEYWTPVGGRTSTLPDPYFYFAILFTLIPQTHTHTHIHRVPPLHLYMQLRWKQGWEMSIRHKKRRRAKGKRRDLNKVRYLCYSFKVYHGCYQALLLSQQTSHTYCMAGFFLKCRKFCTQVTQILHITWLGKQPWPFTPQISKIDGGLLHWGAAWMVWHSHIQTPTRNPELPASWLC